jgi:hypothetical protein
VNEPRGPSGAGFWISCLIGWAVIGFGTSGLLDRLGLGGTFDVGLWVVGGNVLHDVVVAPVVLAVGTALAVVVGRPWRAPIVAGLVASAFVVAVSYPALRGFGRKPHNPSTLPLDYGTAVVTVLAVVWGVVVVWCGLLAARRLIAPPRRSA